MTKTSFCGIFATLFVTTTMVLLASCSQDDDNYESDMYTLAEMGTRLGGEPEIYDNGIEQNTYIPGEENCCGLYTLIARWRDMYGRQAFMNDGIHTPLNAKDMYEKGASWSNMWITNDQKRCSFDENFNEVAEYIKNEGKVKYIED